MGILILGLVLFLGVHSTRIVADGWRTATIGRIGALPWKGIYSLISIATFILVVWGYGLARQQPVVLWSPPAFMRHVTALLMLPVFVLFVAAYVPRNGIKRALGHPQVLSVKLWAFAHLLSNGTVADVLLFGGFLAWAVFSFRAARERDHKQIVQDSWSLETGISPIGSMERASPETRRKGTIICVLAGLAVYAVFVFGLHQALFGVRPV